MPKYQVEVDVISVSAITQPEGLGISALTRGEVFEGEILGKELCEKLLATDPPKISLVAKDKPVKMETMPNSVTTPPPAQPEGSHPKK